MVKEELERRLGELAGKLDATVPLLHQLLEKTIENERKLAAYEATRQEASKWVNLDRDRVNDRLESGDHTFERFTQEQKNQDSDIKKIKAELVLLAQLQEEIEDLRRKANGESSGILKGAAKHVVNHALTAVVTGIGILLLLGLKEWLKSFLTGGGAHP